MCAFDVCAVLQMDTCHEQCGEDAEHECIQDAAAMSVCASDVSKNNKTETSSQPVLIARCMWCDCVNGCAWACK